MVEWTNKIYYINDTTQISMGKFIIVLLVTISQFLAMWCNNGWILSGSMFFLFANAFFMLSKSTKLEEKIAKDNKDLIVSNRIIITELRNEIFALKKKLMKDE
jgi:hypothetical protein